MDGLASYGRPGSLKFVCRGRSANGSATNVSEGDDGDTGDKLPTIFAIGDGVWSMGGGSWLRYAKERNGVCVLGIGFVC
jgi:hypothetical protein